MKGPFADTPVSWFNFRDLIGFRGILGGYPRHILGSDRSKMEALAEQMRQGLA